MYDSFPPSVSQFRTFLPQYGVLCGLECSGTLVLHEYRLLKRSTRDFVASETSMPAANACLAKLLFLIVPHYTRDGITSLYVIIPATRAFCVFSSHVVTFREKAVDSCRNSPLADDLATSCAQQVDCPALIHSFECGELPSIGRISRGESVSIGYKPEKRPLIRFKSVAQSLFAESCAISPTSSCRSAAAG